MNFFHKIKSKLFLIITVLFISLGLSACVDNSNYPSELRIGIHVWPGYEPLHLARSLGHLDDQIKLIEYASASNVIRAIKNGSIDGATLTLDEALLVKQSGIDIVIILANDFSAGGDAILLNSNNKERKSLKGLKIGVEGSAVGAYVLSRALELNGLSVNDITPIQLKPNEQEKPLIGGLVDAVVTFEPYRSRLLELGAYEYFNSLKIPGEIVDVTIVTKSTYQEYPTLVENIVNSWYETIDYIEHQPDTALSRMGNRIHVSASEMKSGFSLIKLPNRIETRNMMNETGKLREVAQNLMEFMIAQNLISTSVDVNDMFPEIQ